MMKMITAFTEEADIAEIAIADIQRCIDGKLLKNSAALIQCHAEFVDSGVMTAVCKALPFETVGISCSLPAVNGSVSPLALTLTVLTSDDCTFFASDFSGSNRENIYNDIKSAVKKLDIGKIPAMAFAYSSFMTYASGDLIVSSFSDAMPDVPVFGSLPISDEADFSRSYTIHNGKYTEDGGVFLGVYGDFAPHFSVTSLREGTIFKTGGRLDKVVNNVLYEIDGMPAWDYVVEKGITTEVTFRNVLGQPMVFTYPDGSQVMRNLLKIDIEEKSLTLAGNVKEGASVDFAVITADDIRHSAIGILSEIEDSSQNASGVIIYSCATRLWTLGIRSTDEIEIVSDILSELPYSFSYSGGEIVPILTDGKYVNTFQNNNFVVCTF